MAISIHKEVHFKKGEQNGMNLKDKDLGSTQFFKVETEPETGVKVVLSTVYEALTEKGYNPISQIVGYIMSGDPTYITSHNNARSLIMKVERDELVEELLKQYIKSNGWDK
ncbi:Uncharacterized protein, UPF0297 family [Lachnospiraceae bacterium KH1T2]|nr:Uncharacterized protein, UPF0297 family [Lachnospiraceae bacterium KH1T2]